MYRWFSHSDFHFIGDFPIATFEYQRVYDIKCCFCKWLRGRTKTSCPTIWWQKIARLPNFRHWLISKVSISQWIGVSKMSWSVESRWIKTPKKGRSFDQNGNVVFLWGREKVSPKVPRAVSPRATRRDHLNFGVGFAQKPVGFSSEFLGQNYGNIFFAISPRKWWDFLDDGDFGNHGNHQNQDLDGFL